MDEQARISVILPSLNVKDYIVECIESVLNQTLTDIEIICVDGGSTDGTLEILKLYAQKDSRVNVFLSSKKSYGNQVNQGIHIATGKYIAIVETDDYIKEDMLEKLYKKTRLDSVDIVKANFYHLYEDENDVILKEDRAKKQIKTEKQFILEQQPLFLEGHPSIWAGIYKRSFLIHNNITFMEEEGGAWVDNPFFYQTAIQADSIVYIDKALYYYRENNQNSSTNNIKDLTIPVKRINDMFNVLKEHDYENSEVKKLLYKRLFRYIEITVENNDNRTDNLNKDVLMEFYKALSHVDKRFVQENLPKKYQQYYYKFRSPLILY